MSEFLFVVGYGGLCAVAGWCFGKASGLKEWAEEVEKVYDGSDN